LPQPKPLHPLVATILRGDTHVCMVSTGIKVTEASLKAPHCTVRQQPLVGGCPVLEPDKSTQIYFVLEDRLNKVCQGNLDHPPGSFLTNKRRCCFCNQKNSFGPSKPCSILSLLFLNTRKLQRFSSKASAWKDMGGCKPEISAR